MNEAHAPSFRPLADPERLWGTQARSSEELVRSPRRVAGDMLRLFLANRTPLTLWGPVGSRKTRTIEALGRERDENGVPYQVITLQPSTQDPTILHGMMYTAIEGERTIMRRSVPRVAEQVMEHADRHGGLTILFADEMTTCAPSQQNALLGLLTHGRFEDIDISPHVTIVMAANPEGTVSTVIPLNEAVMNRGGHVAWFGDPQLFLSEWSTGFAGATTAPEPTTIEFVTALFRQMPDKVFRSADGQWSPDALVPWDMMEHTERAVTEAARLIELIRDTFKGSEAFIADHYVHEAVRALLGPQWADAASAVMDQQADEASAPAIAKWVREIGLDTLVAAGDLDDIDGARDVLWPESLRHDQAAHLLESLTESAFAKKAFSRTHYVGAWAVYASAPNESAQAALASRAAALLVRARDALQAGVIAEAVMASPPKFVPAAAREMLTKELSAK